MKKTFSLILFNVILFSLSGQEKLTDPRDGNTYRIVTIDKITWMVENLKYKTKEGAYYLDNSSGKKTGYGNLYDWKTAMKACPAGWRLPKGVEFQSLVNRFTRKAEWENPASDTTSFGIQLDGMQDYEGTFTEMDQSAYFWTSTEYDKDNAEYFSYVVVVRTPVVDVSRKDDIGDIHGAEKANKYSVRCIKE
jgi:uncharacterized protein (TIGR02145 family)